ncbi:MAG: sugar transferase, partial [Cytophagales bacterium]|nr:sugar transferase [Cytophaga sp.]
MKRSYYYFIPVSSDFVASVFSWILFFFTRKHLLDEGAGMFDIQLVFNAVVIGLFWIMLNALGGAYTDIFGKTRIRELFKGFNHTLIGVVIIFFTLLLDDEGVHQYKEYYKTFTAYFCIQFVFISLSKIIAFTYIRESISSGKIYFNTLLVGSGTAARKVYDELLLKKD